jgi:hypothetical protein
MEKLDLKKELKKYYSPKEKPETVDVPEFSYLTYVGRGEPGGEAYSEALNALYGVAYTLKFASKRQGRDFTVMGLEGQWWWDDPRIFDIANAPPRSEWNWKSMILIPDFVTQKMLEEVKPELVEKKGIAVERVKREKIREGLCVQVLHVGPFSDEPRSIKLMHDYMEEQGLRVSGLHHEIYMSDPRRVAPEKWKTIIRHPVAKK